MAKYTELFIDYINDGGSLPASFETIGGFTDMFKAFYCDKEIGFETEDLFAIKLQVYADLYVEKYKAKIDNYVTAFTHAINPIKVHYERYDTTVNAGAQRAETIDLPINASTATPSSVTKSDAYVNTDAKVTTREESGVTVDEAFFILDKLNDKVHSIVLDLLKEFEPCFMRIY